MVASGNRKCQCFGGAIFVLGVPTCRKKRLGGCKMFQLHKGDLVGGFKHVLFSIIYGIILPND